MELDKRALDRWLTDDRNDYGPADAPTDAPSVSLRPLPVIIADIDSAVTAAHRNALETRRAALAERLMSAPDYAWRDIEHAVWAFDRDRTNRSAAACLAELLVDLTDGAL